jgi:serine/threonine protein kinase
MNPELYQQVKKIVALALELPSDEVRQFLDKECANNKILRNEVEELLNLDMQDDFLGNSPIEVATKQFSEEILTGKIGRITIQKLIARGGMGEVYEGFDETLKRKVAIKVMSETLRFSEKRRADFLNEAQVLSSLHHPNICQIYDFFEEQEKDVLVLELIDGETLRQILDEKTLKNPLMVAYKIAYALTVAHERGIIHKDLKPDNIMITKDGEIKVLDFGLARTGLKHDSHARDINPQLTQVSGTPGYMSPEQANGEKASTATDLWSFGLVLSEILTGKLHFSKNSSSTELLKNAKLAKRNIPNNLPRAETKLIQQLLSVRPADRPTARATLSAIKRIQARPRRRFLLVFAMTLMIVTLFAVWKYTTDLQQERNFALKARADAENLVSFMLDDLHTGLRAVGKLSLLESVANQAFDYYAKLNEQQLQNSDGKSAIAFVRLSEVLTDSGRNHEAIQILEKAFNILEEMAFKNPENDMIAYRFGIVQNNLGDLYKLAGQFKKAQSYLYPAVQLGEKITKGHQPGMGPKQNPNGLMRWKLLLRSMYLLADTYTRSGGGEKAIAILEKVVKLAKPAAQAEEQLTINLSDIQFKRCDTYSELNRLDLMLEPCLSTLKLDLALHEDNPKNYEYHKNLIGDYAKLTHVYRKLKLYNDGLLAVNKGLELGDSMIDWDTDNVNMKNEYVSILLAKARLLKDMNNIDESQALFKQAYDIILPISQDHEEITYLNHTFIALVHLGYIEHATKIGTIMDLRGFKRREFKELCTQYNISQCRDEDK